MANHSAKEALPCHMTFSLFLAFTPTQSRCALGSNETALNSSEGKETLPPSESLFESLSALKHCYLIQYFKIPYLQDN